MNSSKSSNPIKMVAFFLVAIILTATVSYAAGGWQAGNLNPDSSNADNGNQNSGDADNNKDPNPPEDDVPVVNPIPEFTDYLTGLEITEEESFKKPICFVYGTDKPLYGISTAKLVVEIPTEDGATRFVAFTTKAQELGKIGSIAPTRGYISNIAAFFDGVLAADGNDDSFKYNSLKSNEGFLDFSENTGYHYTEYTSYVYTNRDLLNAFINSAGVSTVKTTATSMPFIFNDFYQDNIIGKNTATSVIIPFSSGNSSEFFYSKETGRYTMSKNSTVKTDLLNDDALAFDNLFVLFADATTYETAEATETVLDTLSGGTGYYVTMGTYIPISWSTDSQGNLVFLDENGNNLKVNRGNSYISYVKSSKTSEIKIG